MLKLTPLLVNWSLFKTALAIASLCIATVFNASAADGDTPAPARAQTESKPTPSANVSKLQAWKDAELIASLGEGRLEVVGSGDSMRPVYGDHTILVISRIKYADLRPGMTIAYTNLRGHRVVHQLLKHDYSGWRVQGLNNDVEDRDRVKAENLIGVVYASLAYDPDL